MQIDTKTVPGRRYFCVADEVTQPEIPLFAQRAVGPLVETAKKQKLEIVGDLELICPIWNGEMKSRVIFAIPIGSNSTTGCAGSEAQAALPEPYFFWNAPVFTCAWTDYKGPMHSIKAAWATLGDAVKARGLHGTPNMAWREVYKFWEDFNSENNVTELQVEIG